MVFDSNPGQSVYSETFLVGDFEIDPATHSINKSGDSIKLEPRTMELLLYLAHRPGLVVSREELEREVWQGMVIGYDALNNTVAKLRKAFDDDASSPTIIETVPKRGYRLIANVRPHSQRRWLIGKEWYVVPTQGKKTPFIPKSNGPCL